jgi:hypothetical protein
MSWPTCIATACNSNQGASLCNSIAPVTWFSEIQCSTGTEYWEIQIAAFLNGMWIPNPRWFSVSDPRVIQWQLVYSSFVIHRQPVSSTLTVYLWGGGGLPCPDLGEVRSCPQTCNLKLLHRANSMDRVVRFPTYQSKDYLEPLSITQAHRIYIFLF